MTAIRPFHDSLAAHASIEPVACVPTPIVPLVTAEALELIVLEVTFVGAPICPASFSLTTLSTCNKVADKGRFVRPDLHPQSVLLVFDPEATMFCTICVHIGTKAIGLIIRPIALINVSISMDQSAIVIDAIIEKIALVETTIRPDDQARSMTL